MNTLETFAIILASLILLKIVVILIRPHAWFNYVVKPVYGHPIVSGSIFLILLAWTGSKVLELYSIVEIMAMLLPLTLLMAIGFLPFSKSLLGWYEDLAAPKMIRKAWISIVVWVVVALWAFYSVFI